MQIFSNRADLVDDVYSTDVLVSRAVSLVGVAIALAGPVVAQAPAGDVDLVPVLTSAPFGAVGGQSVSHTILVSGTGTGNVTGLRVTFTTTVGLDGAVAGTTRGRCSIVDKLTVVCELGVVEFATADTAPPKVTINGTVAPGSVAGTLVQNLVKVASEPPDSDVSNNAASNAYLTPGLHGGPTGRPAVATSSGGTARRPGYLAPVAAGVLVFGVLAGVILLRRHRVSRTVTDRAPEPM
jgi:hypothetical protein